MTTPLPLPASGDNPLVFDVGQVHVAVWPSCNGRLARFLLFRSAPDARGPVLFQSGSEHDTASCVVRATYAAYRAEAGT